MRRLSRGLPRRQALTLRFLRHPTHDGELVGLAERMGSHFFAEVTP